MYSTVRKSSCSSILSILVPWTKDRPYFNLNLTSKCYLCHHTKQPGKVAALWPRVDRSHTQARRKKINLHGKYQAYNFGKKGLAESNVQTVGNMLWKHYQRCLVPRYNRGDSIGLAIDEPRGVVSDYSSTGTQGTFTDHPIKPSELLRIVMNDKVEKVYKCVVNTSGNIEPTIQMVYHGMLQWTWRSSSLRQSKKYVLPSTSKHTSFMQKEELTDLQIQAD